MLKNMKLARKIGIGFGAMVLVIGVAVTATWFSMHEVQQMVVLNDRASQGSEQFLQRYASHTCPPRSCKGHPPDDDANPGASEFHGFNN